MAEDDPKRLKNKSVPFLSGYGGRRQSATLSGIPPWNSLDTHCTHVYSFAIKTAGG